ncbi:MAG: hypothetical protein JWO95_2450 [Verrucomicrobiales bacterium]|nr:hypothetical protein [Verrucomicrobiales bacterium]
MIRSRRRAHKNSRAELGSEFFTLSKAKTYLGRLIDKASAGETVYIVKGHKRFILQPVAEIDPIPVRPPCYFANIYSKAEIAEENKLAKASVIAAPKDLE